MKMKNRLWAILLSMTIVLTYMPALVFAEGVEDPAADVIADEQIVEESGEKEAAPEVKDAAPESQEIQEEDTSAQEPADGTVPEVPEIPKKGTAVKKSVNAALTASGSESGEPGEPIIGRAGTCKITIDNGDATIEPIDGESGVFDSSEWSSYRYGYGIKTIKFVGNISCDHCVNLFAEMESLESIDFGNFDTSNTDDMNYMFAQCTNLKSLDLSSFDTSNVTDMHEMFYNCESLESLDVSSFDTSNVTDMNNMFTFCYKLQSLDVSHFDTDNVTGMGGMFLGCGNVPVLDVSGFDTSKVTTMDGMFMWCKALTGLDVSGFDTSNVTSMSNMFASCQGLTELDVSGFDTGNVTNMDSMFFECSGLSSLDVSSFDTSKVTDMGYMFYECSGLHSLNVSNFNTANVTNMSGMFQFCDGLYSLDLSNFNTAGVTDMSYMFCRCKNMYGIDLSSFNTAKVRNMNSMFSYCSNLGSVNLSSFNTRNLTSMEEMFFYCERLQSVDLSSFDLSNLAPDQTSGVFVMNLKLHQIYTPRNVKFDIDLYGSYYDNAKKEYRILPKNLSHSVLLVDDDSYSGSWISFRISDDDTVAVGKTLQLSAMGVPDIKWKSSNKAVATVTSTGKVKGVKPGKATITAYSAADPTSKATFKIYVKYKLTYKMNGGTNSDDNPTWYTGKVTLKNPKARKGYEFKGWYSDSKFKTRVRTVSNTNKTLYAKWEVNGYSIKFVKNGGTGSLYYQRCRYGKTFNLPACHYTRKGYTFTGWNTKADGSGKAYADKASFKNLTSKDGATVSLYAQWKATKYTIKYSGLPAGAKNDNKTSYTISTATFRLKDASCPGYTFKGWFSDSKKTKPITSIAKGSTGSKTIYSKWAAHKYTIKFNANGGAGTMGSMKSCAYGKKYALTKNAYTFNNAKFTGWNTKADGTGTTYADGAEVINLVTEDGGSITLYAQWVKEPYWPVRANDGTPITEIVSHPGDIVAGNSHRGIDVGGADGANWYACTSGTIVYVFRGCITDGSQSHAGCSPNHPELQSSSNGYGVVCNNGFGNGCIIRSVINGKTYYFQYAHMDSVSDSLVENTEISAGTYLGKVGNKGFSFGTHAHFEVDLETSPGSYWGTPVDNDPESSGCIFNYVY